MTLNLKKASATRRTKSAWLCALALPAALALSPVAAKTLVYCSEGSPENFYPGVNTTGTSFDVTEQIYDNLVHFERGGTLRTLAKNIEDFRRAGRPAEEIAQLERMLEKHSQHREMHELPLDTESETRFREAFDVDLDDAELAFDPPE